MDRITRGRGMLAAGLLAASLAVVGTAFASNAKISAVRIAATDDVLLTGANFDLGDGTLVSGKPDTSAKLRWLVDGGKLKPELVGDIFIKGGKDDCGIVELQAKDAAGTDV